MIPMLGIVNANTRSVQDSSLPVPNMRGTLNNWMQALALTKVIKQSINFDIKESYVPLSTRGMIQPFGAEELSLKPDGQRDWTWQMLHTTIDLVLKPDDVVIIKEVRYRVMSKTDCSQYGYVQYHLIQDYERAPHGAN